MKNNVYGRYTIPRDWSDILWESSLIEDEEYRVMKDKIYLYVPTDLKELESFITRLFGAIESD